MNKKFLVFGSPRIEKEEIREVVRCLKSGWIGTGPIVHQFEEMFRQFKGTRFAMALNSCTAALHLAMQAIGLQAGEEVIIPALTFAATANAVIHAGGRPVLADCQRDTMNLDVRDVERKITPRTRALIPVHFAGRPCAMEPLLELGRRHGLKMVEDCAHAIESEYQGKKIGTFGDIGCFSFYVTKNIITGEGGMAITDNPEYAEKIKILALHGMSQDAWKRYSDEGFVHYQVVYAGYKYNMMDMQAALGIHQLPRIERYWQRRKEIWESYQTAFQDLPVFVPAPSAAESKHSLHLYTLLLDLEQLSISRDQFLELLTARGIGAGVHYLSLNLHPFYQQKYGYKKGDFPNAEWISERTVSLPLSAKLSDSDVQRVQRAVISILRKARCKRTPKAVPPEPATA